MNLVLQHPAAAAGEADARALPAPVACGSGQLVRAPQEATAPSGPSVGRSAPRLDDTPNAPVYRRRGASGEHQGSMPVRDRRPGMERSVHTRTRANRDRATCTPIEYVGPLSYAIDVLISNLVKIWLDLVWEGPTTGMPLGLVLPTLVLTLTSRPQLRLRHLPCQMQAIALTLLTTTTRGSYFFAKLVLIHQWQ